MAGAVGCFFVFILLSLSGKYHVWSGLLYLAIVALALGAILFWFGIMKDGKQ
jgi:NADH:ubiquinone oxidoreductase subunit 6 (subunit J)